MPIRYERIDLGYQTVWTNPPVRLWLSESRSPRG